MTDNSTIESRRRVLLVGPLPPPIGGDTVSTANLLSSRYWNASGFDMDFVDTSAGGGVKLAEIKRSWKDPLRAIRILGQLIVRLLRADILLLWANSSFICSLGIPVMRIALMMRKPYIVKIFGAMLPERIGGLGPRRQRTVISLLGKARYLLPQTKALAKELSSMKGLGRDRVVQFPNFLPDSYFRDLSLKKRFSGMCVFIGQIKSEKGVFDIIESIRDRKDIICDFYGQHVEKDRDRFMRELEGLPNCIYRGTLARDEVMRILDGYDVLLLPTTHPGEGYPAVILEAFAAGLPVIATDWKAIPELVEDGVRGLLVPPHSPRHISAALDLLSDDERLYASLARNAHEYVIRFSENSVVGDLLTGLISDSTG